MSCTVFANDDGFFHKGSGGSSKAYPDVCLSPPPPPTGPVPVPYPNRLSASDLTDGSRTVKIQGKETALESQSYVATSTGDEGGTQGGNVVTHKTKGKGYFLLWSFDVQVEGKGVCRHNDPMGQNCASNPFGAPAPKASVEAYGRAARKRKKCKEKYKAKEHRHSMTQAQYDAVAKGPCWQCRSPSPLGWYRPPNKKTGFAGSALVAGPDDCFTPDHQPPSFVLWYLGGCEDRDGKFKDQFQDPNGVKPHCRQCSNKQGAFSSASRKLRKAHGAR